MTIRIVLAGWAEDDWRTYRQPQWIGQIRRDPGAASRPRRHFDIEEDSYQACLARWDRDRAGSSLSSARQCLVEHGAVEVAPP